MLRIHHRIHQGKLSSFGYVTTRDAQRPGKTPTKKTRERWDKIEETWVRTKPKKPPRPSYEAEKNNNNKRKYTHHIYR